MTTAQYTAKYLDLLDEVRVNPERGLTVLAVIKQLDDVRVLVVLQDDNGLYHLHRYFMISDSKWAYSIDAQAVAMHKVWCWLEEPGAIPMGDY